MHGRTAVFRGLATGVGLVASTVLTVMIGAVLPAPAGAGLFVGGPALLCVLLSGRAEGLMVRLLAGAREPHEFELAALRPAFTLVAQRGLFPPQVDVLVRRRVAGIHVGAAGRQTVVVSQGLVSACARGDIRTDTTAALLAHAIGRIRLGQTKLDVATEFWMLPWRLVRAAARTLGLLVRWFPLARLAWRVRAVVGLAALYQATTEGQAVNGGLAAAVVAVSYALPWCERRADHLAEDEADQVVVEAGLGDPLARFLSRGRPTPRALARIHRLRGPVTRPHLAVVA